MLMVAVQSATATKIRANADTVAVVMSYLLTTAKTGALVADATAMTATHLGEYNESIPTFSTYWSTGKKMKHIGRYTCSYQDGDFSVTVVIVESGKKFFVFDDGYSIESMPAKKALRRYSKRMELSFGHLECLDKLFKIVNLKELGIGLEATNE